MTDHIVRRDAEFIRRCLSPLILMVVLRLCWAEPLSNGLYCDCHVAGGRSTNIAVHCFMNETEDKAITCHKNLVTDMPSGYSFIPGYAIAKLYRSHATFDRAKHFCKKDGGRLAIPTDAAAVAGLQDLFSKQPQIFDAFIGVTDLQTEGVFKGLDGLPAPYLKWAAGAPNNYNGNENCVLVGKDGIMNDVPCNWQKPFLCERRLSRVIPSEYRWVEDSGRFLRVSDDSKTYEEAQLACHDDGGTLAVLDTWKKAEAVFKMLPFTDEHFFVGLDCKKTEGVFVTATGRLLSDMEFQVWKDGEPSGSWQGQKESCLAVQGFGFYNDIRCFFPVRFICEIEPL